MIRLERSMTNKWIVDKNVNSKDSLEELVAFVKTKLNGFDEADMVKNTSSDTFTTYAGRNYKDEVKKEKAAKITMQVRLLQACFYMLGYSYNLDSSHSGTLKKIFTPSPTMLNILETDVPLEKARNCLVNLFSLQYPHPYSHTPSNFEIYAGRLILKLLIDERINQRLYIDEIIWFIPFIERIDESIYSELVESIIEYRSLGYEEKLQLFRSVRNYDNLFANVAHEMNYYFIRLFEDWGVFCITADSNHNGGRLFSFCHTGKTFRNDAYKSRATCSGYISLNPELLNDARLLTETYSLFDKVVKENDEDIATRNDWMTILYETNPIDYLSTIGLNVNQISEVDAIIKNMIHKAKYGSSDGKEFENALKPFMELFDDAIEVKVYSGAGNTDLLCVMRELDPSIYKVNIEAKTRSNSLSDVNPSRINRHLIKHGSKYCIIVAPKFSLGVKEDIRGQKIVAIRAEELGAYCRHSCYSSKLKIAEFKPLNDIICANMGKDITEDVRQLIAAKFSVAV